MDYKLKHISNFEDCTAQKTKFNKNSYQHSPDIYLYMEHTCTSICCERQCLEGQQPCEDNSLFQIPNLIILKNFNYISFVCIWANIITVILTWLQTSLVYNIFIFCQVLVCLRVTLSYILDLCTHVSDLRLLATQNLKTANYYFHNQINSAYSVKFTN